jgi:hypothetical protein
MSVLTSILSKITGQVLDSANQIIDTSFTSDEQKSEAKEKLSVVITDALNQAMAIQADVLKTEMQGNWLQKSWRPITMLVFTAIVTIGAFKQIDYLESTSPFWSLLELGLGGYVVGRSVEKVAETVTKNVDMPFLKKKDRA